MNQTKYYLYSSPHFERIKDRYEGVSYILAVDPRDIPLDSSIEVLLPIEPDQLKGKNRYALYHVLCAWVS